MYTLNSIGLGLFVLRMLKIFPRDPEPEVEGGDSCVVAVRNRKQHDAQVKKQDTLLVRRGDSLHS